MTLFEQRNYYSYPFETDALEHKLASIKSEIRRLKNSELETAKHLQESAPYDAFTKQELIDLHLSREKKIARLVERKTDTITISEKVPVKQIDFGLIVLSFVLGTTVGAFLYSLISILLLHH